MNNDKRTPYPPPPPPHNNEYLSVLKDVRPILRWLLIISTFTMLGTCGSCSALNSARHFTPTQ